jgi:hypothetical protein
LDDSSGAGCPLAPRSGYILHARGIHSHPAARSASDICDQFDPGAKASGLAANAQNMKPNILAGILLVVLGGLALAYQGFNYTRRDRVLDLGPIHATADVPERVSIPPIVGGLALVGGIALLVVGGKKNP